MSVPALDDAPDVYAEVRSELIALARGLDEAQAATTVPMCPAWSIKDVYAHVVGINADLISGNIAGVGTEAWTAAQVESRADHSLQEVCDEWERLQPKVDAAMAETNGLALRAGADLSAHRLDVLSTLGRDDDRNGRATQLALFRYGPEVVGRVAEAGLPVLELIAGDQRWVSADGPVSVSLTATPFELFRVLTGRRSEGQTRALAWSRDPTEYLSLLSPYGVAAVDLIE